MITAFSFLGELSKIIFLHTLLYLTYLSWTGFVFLSFSFSLSPSNYVLPAVRPHNQHLHWFPVAPVLSLVWLLSLLLAITLSATLPDYCLTYHSHTCFTCSSLSRQVDLLCLALSSYAVLAVLAVLAWMFSALSPSCSWPSTSLPSAASCLLSLDWVPALRELPVLLRPAPSPSAVHQPCYWLCGCSSLCPPDDRLPLYNLLKDYRCTYLCSWILCSFWQYWE